MAIESEDVRRYMEATKEILITTALTLWGLLVAFVLVFIPRRFRYKDVSGQVVLITGAGSGIGRLMAKKFALQHGAIVVAWDINKAGCDETVKDIRAGGGKCHGYIVDVSKREQIYEAAEKVKTEVGKVDILINNAGIVSGSKFLDTQDSQIEKTFQVNSLSNFWTTKAFLPGMIKEDSGHIVTIASTAGLVGVNRLVDYCASKYAAVGFHEALLTELKSELGQQGINATLVCPYYINTGMFDGVKSKLISILNPDDVVNDVVAGILTNQESVVIPRYILLLVVAKFFVPAQVGMRVQAALGITGTMMTFKGRK